MAKVILNKKTKTNWQKEFTKDTGINVNDTPFIKWPWEKMQFIFRKYWWSIFEHVKKNDYTLNNIVAITGKDTRKTTVFVIFIWFLMVEYPWLNAFMLRDTLDKAVSEMRKQLRKGVMLATNEYDIDLSSYTAESNDGFYLVRDNMEKNNQKIELMSFDKMVEIGGFTTNNGYPAICLYDELQNPQSAHKEIMTDNQWLANYKFVNEKLRALEIATKKELPKWVPRNIFTSNRYVGVYPLNTFAELHLPYYDQIDEETGKEVKGVKSWMLEDPLNNNFIFQYFGKEDMKPGWEDMWGTVIVYASKLSNDILRADKEWEAEQLRLIERGNEDDLARVIGDLFEGYEGMEQTYFYTRKEEIDLDTFKQKYAKHVDKVRISVDLDYSRQIVLSAKYDCRKDIFANNQVATIYRLIRDKIVKIKCNGVDDNGRRTAIYLKQLWKAIVKYCVEINKLMPHIKKIRIIIDDKKANVVKDFNFGQYKNKFWVASKVNFDQKWKIMKRPKVIDDMQDSGFIIDIKHPTNKELHMAYKGSIIDPNKKKKQRLEKANDPTIDLINVDEYGVYDSITRMAFNNRSTRLLGGKNEW